jgi:hypothetical protein
LGLTGTHGRHPDVVVRRLFQQFAHVNQTFNARPRLQRERYGSNTSLRMELPISAFYTSGESLKPRSNCILS